MSYSSQLSQEVLERSFGTFASDADFWSHAGILGLTHDELEGRSVLEIGSGRSNRFVLEGKEEVAMERIITINTQLASKELCDARGIDPKLHGGAVVALAQGQLPFRDASFDTIVSLMGVPKYLYMSELPALFNEVERLLKPGGVTKFWPATTLGKDEDHALEPVYEFDVGFEQVDARILELLDEPFRSATTRLILRSKK